MTLDLLNRLKHVLKRTIENGITVDARLLRVIIRKRGAIFVLSYRFCFFSRDAAEARHRYIYWEGEGGRRWVHQLVADFFQLQHFFARSCVCLMFPRLFLSVDRCRHPAVPGMVGPEQRAWNFRGNVSERLRLSGSMVVLGRRNNRT